MKTTKTVYRGRLTNAGVIRAHKELSDWLSSNASRIIAIRADFQEWVEHQVKYIRKIIDEKSAIIIIRSNVSHLVSTLKRMESGEIVAVTIRKDGGGFTLR